jgi:hypothetical protein
MPWAAGTDNLWRHFFGDPFLEPMLAEPRLLNRRDKVTACGKALYKSV